SRSSTFRSFRGKLEFSIQKASRLIALGPCFRGVEQIELAAQDFQRCLMDAFVAGHDDATPALCRAIFPRRNDATRAGNDRDERYNVVWLDLSLDDQIDQARRQHAIGIAIAAVARELHLVL